VTAAELLSPAADDDRTAGRVVELASGLLMLLNAPWEFMPHG